MACVDWYVPRIRVRDETVVDVRLLCAQDEFFACGETWVLFNHPQWDIFTVNR